MEYKKIKIRIYNDSEDLKGFNPIILDDSEINTLPRFLTGLSICKRYLELATKHMYLMNIIGKYISKGMIDNRFVEWVVMENGKEINKGGFDKDGMLSGDWKIGYFRIGHYPDL